MAREGFIRVLWFSRRLYFRAEEVQDIALSGFKGLRGSSTFRVLLLESNKSSYERSDAYGY